MGLLVLLGLQCPLVECCAIAAALGAASDSMMDVLRLSSNTLPPVSYILSRQAKGVSQRHMQQSYCHHCEYAGPFKPAFIAK